MRDSDIKVGKKTVINGKVLDSTIGSNCKIEGFVKNSVIGDNVIIHKDSVVEDSIIGDNVEFRGTIETKDEAEVKIKDKLISVANFGAAIGDNCVLLDVLLEPGTLIWPGIKKKNKELKGVIKK